MSIAKEAFRAFLCYIQVKINHAKLSTQYLKLFIK